MTSRDLVIYIVIISMNTCLIVLDINVPWNMMNWIHPCPVNVCFRIVYIVNIIEDPKELGLCGFC